jgi:hypothetical protein
MPAAKPTTSEVSASEPLDGPVQSWRRRRQLRRSLPTLGEVAAMAAVCDPLDGAASCYPCVVHGHLAAKR